MKTRTIIVIATLLIVTSIARANLIGRVTFTGDFTLNHLYDFNNPGLQPFGTFTDQTVIFSNGIFAPYIQAGQTVNGQQLWTEGALPLFTIGGFSLVTQIVGINGPDSGRYVFGLTDLSGNGYLFDLDHSLWTFIAPPYDISDFHQDITEPITLQFAAFKDVPDTGSSLALMGCSLLGLFVYARRLRV